jgi:hypothetical protein
LFSVKYGERTEATMPVVIIHRYITFNNIQRF